MLILITGVPGSGKTLYAVQELENYKKENQKLIEQGHPPREIYSDIDGLNIEGVKQSPNDWRECPDGSIVFYDECQQKFGPDGQGRSSRSDIQEFETHRHRGFDIVLITQHPKLLHAHIRRLVGRHYHVFRMYGAETAKIFRRDGQMDIDKASSLNQQDHFMWSYPKENFGKYKSATIHTHKRHLPAWIKRSLIGMAVAGVIFVFLVPMALPFFTGSFYGETLAAADNINEVPVSKNEITTERPITIRPPQPVACISNDDKCHCYDSSGYLIEQPYFQCIENTLGTPSFIDLKPNLKQRAVASADG
jgi:zona occludens toxin